MKKILAVFVVLLLIAIGGTLYLVYEYNAIDTDAVPVIAVSVDSKDMFLEKVDWDVPFLFNKIDKKVQAVYSESDETQVAIESEKSYISTTPETASVDITVTNQQDEIVFTGTDKEFNESFYFTENEKYYITANVQLNTDKQGAGNAEFKITADVNITRPVEYLLTKTVIKQGEASSIILQNIPESVTPIATSEIGKINFTATQNEGEYKAVIPSSYATQTGEYSIEIDIDGEKTSHLIQVEPEEFEVQRFDMAESVTNTALTYNSKIEFEQVVHPTYETVDPEVYWQGEFIQPVVNRITSPYGVIRYINSSPNSVRHEGIDIASPIGTPIIAPNHGVVEVAQFLERTGYTIIIEHGGGLKSHFYHMDSIDVEVGDMVEKGQTIGEVGTTGYSTGPHLHYEIKVGKVTMSPWPFFDGTSVIFE